MTVSTFHWPSYDSVDDMRSLAASVQSLTDHLAADARLLVSYNGAPAGWKEWLARVRPVLPGETEVVNVWEYHHDLTRAAYSSLICTGDPGRTNGSPFLRKWLGYCVPGLCPSPSVYLDTDVITLANPAHVLEALRGGYARYPCEGHTWYGDVDKLWWHSDYPHPLLRNGNSGTVVFPASLTTERFVEEMHEVIMSLQPCLSAECAEQGIVMTALGRFPSAPLSTVLYRFCHPRRDVREYGHKDLMQEPVEMIHYILKSLFSHGPRTPYIATLLRQTEGWAGAI
jgi:hypothetical protein